MGYWTTIETCVGVISACLPTLRPVLKKLGDGWRSSGAFSWQTFWRIESGDSFDHRCLRSVEQQYGRPDFVLWEMSFSGNESRDGIVKLEFKDSSTSLTYDKNNDFTSY